MKNLISLIICLFMTICITSVYGQTNIAAGKSAKQSSTYGTYPANLATDGVKEGFGKLSHTNSELGAWWEIDLGASYAISSIKVYNATDHPTRMNDFTILVSETAFTGNTGGTAFVSNEPAPMPTKSYTGNATGRYVRLFLNGTNYLTIHEIEIFGTLQTGITPTETNEVSSEIGNVKLYNQGRYNLKVFVGREVNGDAIGKEIGNLLSDDVLELKGVKKGAKLRFVPFGRGDHDNVDSEVIYLWSVDDQDYFVYAQESSDVRSKAQNLDLNLNGIDIVTLNPRDILAGKKDQIFEEMGPTSVDYNSLRGADGEYIKEGFEYDHNPRGKGENKQKMRYKSESVKNSWSINVDLSGSAKVKGVNIDGGVGVGYEEFDESHRDQKEIYIEKSEWKQKYGIKTDSSRADLDYRFKADVLKLPEVYDHNKYQAFVRNYGTHYLKEVVYGGFYNSYMTMSENAFNSLQGNNLNVKADLGVSKGGAKDVTESTDPTGKLGKLLGEKRSVKKSSNNKNGVKLAVEYNKKHEEALSEAFQDIDAGWEYGGGDGSYEGWGLTNAEDAIPIIIKPQLISELIQPQVFRDDTDHKKLQNIKTNLEKYLKDYIATMPPKNLLDAPPVGYNLEITEVKITNYKDEVDATKKADINIKAYSGLLNTFKAKSPQISYRRGEVKKQLVREANINPEQKLGRPLGLISPKIGLVVKPGNPDKRVFKIIGTFKEHDSNFGGAPEEWVCSAYINTDLTDANPTRTDELKFTHSAVRWGAKQQFDVVIKYRLTRNSEIFDIPEGSQVKLSNQAENLSTTELVTDDAINASKKITFRHKGLYIAKYSIEYMYNGQKQNLYTGEITSVTEGSYDIPADATNVIVKAEGFTGLSLQPTTVHFQQTYPTAVSRIIESYGTTLAQSYKELNEKGVIISQGNTPPPPPDTYRITFKNRGAYDAKYTLHYMSQGRKVEKNSGKMHTGRDQFYDIPRNATSVYIKAEGFTGWFEETHTHFEKTFPTAVTKTIESHGASRGQTAKVN